ncbi:MAG: hypothetical protein J7551_07785 [Chloroflexi bacterium]|nr:hypothetical protein [Chloroflexota bacterium]
MSHLLAERDRSRLIKSLIRSLQAQRLTLDVASERIAMPELYSQHSALGVWSAKDIAAYAMAWDRRRARQPEAYRRRELFAMSEKGYTWADADLIFTS